MRSYPGCGNPIKGGHLADEIASIGTTAAYFTGMFDGNCRTICGIDVDDTPDAVKKTAMFGVYCKGAAVKNLTVMNAAVDGSAPNPGQCYTAILVGEKLSIFHFRFSIEGGRRLTFMIFRLLIKGGNRI